MRVYVVEHRECLSASSTDFDSTTAYFSSTKEKALEFIQKNVDFDSRNITWWWAIYSEEMDRPISYDGLTEISLDDLEFYDWNGNLLNYQPYLGYQNA